MNRVTAILIAVLAASLFGLTYYHYRVQSLNRDVAEITAVANQQKKDLQLIEAQRQAVAAIDIKYTKELADAKSENDDLRRKLDRGGRVLVKTNCPAPNASPGSLGYAGTVELSSIAGRNVLDIRAGIISDQTKIKYLQDYIRLIIDERNKK